MMPYDSLCEELARHAEAQRRLKALVGVEICGVLSILEDARQHAAESLLRSDLDVDELKTASARLVKRVSQLDSVRLKHRQTSSLASATDRELAAGVVDRVSLRLRDMLSAGAAIRLQHNADTATVTLETCMTRGDVVESVTVSETALRMEPHELRREVELLTAEAVSTLVYNTVTGRL